MRVDFTGTPGTDWQLVGGTYTFSGPPDDCTGTLTLRNLSMQRVRIRRLETQLPSRGRRGLEALAPTDVRLRVTLLPDSETQATTRLDLPDHTPPGRYMAHLKVGDEKATLEIDVEPTRVLELDPEDILLVGRAAETIPFTVNLFNAGNIPINILSMAPVWLTEEDWNRRILASALQDAGENEDFATFAQRLLDKARQDIPAPAQLTVNPQPEFELAPGGSVDVALALTLPDNLVAGREYSGIVRINEETVELEVFCSGLAERAPIEVGANNINEH